MMTGNHIRPCETNVIKRLRKHHKLSQKSAQW